MHGVIGQDQARQIVEGLKLRVAAGGGEEDWQAALLNGRVLKLTMQPRGDGGVVVLFEDVTEHNQAQARINELARFDSLTGLPNRVEFGERGAAVLAAKPDDVDAALLFIDLDQFKQVNDTLGHAVGDHLLRAAAERLRRAVGPDDLVARLGGDEFVVLIGAAQSLAPIEGVGARSSACWRSRLKSPATSCASAPALALHDRSTWARSSARCCDARTLRSMKPRPRDAACGAYSN